VKGIVPCLYYNHLRLYYADSILLDSSKKETHGSGAAMGRDYYDRLFKLEREWKKLAPEERKRSRVIYSVPVLEAFFV